MKKFFIATFSFALSLCCGCKSNKSLDQTSYNKIVRTCSGNQNKDLIVCYFDGDCGLCLAKVKLLEEKYNKDKNLNVVFIAKTFNPDIMKYYLSAQKIKSCVYLESKNEFEKVLKFDNVIELYTDHSYEDIEIK